MPSWTMVIGAQASAGTRSSVRRLLATEAWGRHGEVSAIVSQRFLAASEGNSRSNKVYACCTMPIWS